jgi:hypothetical protein
MDLVIWIFCIGVLIWLLLHAEHLAWDANELYPFFLWTLWTTFSFFSYRVMHSCSFESTAEKGERQWAYKAIIIIKNKDETPTKAH